MKSRQKLTLEIQKLNQRLDQISNNSRFMIYSANPFKFALFNFIAGVFHSLGSLFGTIVIAGMIFYVFSQFDFVGYFSDFMTETLRQIDFQKIIMNQRQ